jgi:hypothetical protein
MDDPGDPTAVPPLHNSGRDDHGRFIKGNPARFRPGRSGNPAGRPVSALLSQAMRLQLAERYPGDRRGRTYASKIAESVARAAVEGDIQAARELADRTEGKPRQAIDLETHNTDIGAQLRAAGLSIDEAEAETERVLDELHNLRLSSDEIN